MFTGIIEDIGIIKSIEKDRTNLILEIRSKISKSLKPDQSVAHNGVCLTITKNTKKSHFVTAVKETLNRSNLCDVKVGDSINLERSLVIGSRLDGHFVQGHIDECVKILKRINQNGSTELQLYNCKRYTKYLVMKGSICINGVSLTIAKLKKNSFSVVIIPYTMENTNLSKTKPGDWLNIEFDILGKYINNKLSVNQSKSFRSKISKKLIKAL